MLVLNRHTSSFSLTFHSQFWSIRIQEWNAAWHACVQEEPVKTGKFQQSLHILPSHSGQGVGCRKVHCCPKSITAVLRYWRRLKTAHKNFGTVTFYGSQWKCPYLGGCQFLLVYDTLNSGLCVSQKSQSRPSYLTFRIKPCLKGKKAVSDGLSLSQSCLQMYFPLLWPQLQNWVLILDLRMYYQAFGLGNLDN